MIYMILGTMGEYTKMVPIMQLFDKNKIEYKFIHTCQHYAIIEQLRKRLHGKKPDLYLTLKKKDLANIWELILWIPKVLFNARKLPITKEDFVIVHGDAESALLAFLIGKFFRAKIVHVEAGLRSHNFFEPFAEEIIRTFIDRFADVCFPTYEKNIKNIKRCKEIFSTQGSTVFDTLKEAIKIKPSLEVGELIKKQYVVFTVHRKENLMVKNRLTVILNILEKILKSNYLVIWPMHANSVYELKSKGFSEKIQEFKNKYKLQTDHFFDYVDMAHIIKNCQFVASDGGAFQTETYFLNRPMLILRKMTEIVEGIGETAYLSCLDKGRVDIFLKKYKSFKRKTKIQGSPSKIVLNFFKKNLS